jgi:hypothetical protein
VDIAWSNSAPTTVARRILILKPGEGALVTFLAEHLGAYIHWITNRSQPCMDKDCQHCAERVPRRWRAYLPALVRRCIKMGIDKDARQIPVWGPRAEEMVVELSEAHAEYLGGLAGMQAQLWKPKGNNRLPLRVIISGPAEGELAPAFDVKPVLFRIWGIPEQATLRVHHGSA